MSRRGSGLAVATSSEKDTRLSCPSGPKAGNL